MRQAVLVAILLLSACLSGEATDEVSSDVADASATATEDQTSARAADAQTSAPTQVEAPPENWLNTPVTEQAVFVHGTAPDCGWPDQALAARTEATTTWLGTLHCTSDMSDPRVAGTEEWELTAPFFYTEYFQGPKTAAFKASVTLTTEEGMWRGQGFGVDMWVQGVIPRTTFFAEYVGEGAYEGLIYREWGANHPRSDGYLITGYILPTE